MKKCINVPALLFLLIIYSYRTFSQTVLYKDKNQIVETRVNDLLSRMTLEEKVSLLIINPDTLPIGRMSSGMMGSLNNALEPKEAAILYNKVTRYLKEKTKFGIPAFKEAEAIFAYMGNGGTSFPVPLGQAACFDPQAVSTVADVIGDEVKARGVKWVLSPVLNIARDARWGRSGETYGEDPYLISRMGVAYVKTMEGKGVVTTLKHFAGNTGHEGRFGTPTFYSERYLREYEFPPYEAAFKEGGSKSVMMAYNTIDGIPCAQNDWLMKKVIKGEWGMDGVIMSDGDALDFILDDFGIDSSRTMVAAKAINAGCDFALSNPDAFYRKPMIQAEKEGLVSEHTVTESARRMLRQVFRTGLYDDPYVDPEKATLINNSKEHQKLSLEIAKKSMVLLKNERNTLPFSKKVKNVLVVGPLGDRLLINHYAGWGRKDISVVEGIKELLPQANVVFEKGVELGYTYYPAIEQKYFFHKKNGKASPGLVAEYFDNGEFSGTPKISKIDPQINFDWKEGSPNGLDKDLFTVRWTGYLMSPGSGTYTIGVNGDDAMKLFIDEKLVINMWPGPSNSLFVESTDFKFEKGKEYKIKVEYREMGGKSFAKVGWNVDLFGGIKAALEQAKKADVVVAVVGMFEDENGDRATLDLDEGQERLILELSKTGKPLVVVLQSGNVITMNKWLDKIPAVLSAWYPGQQGGQAIASTIFGDNNPGGKLPITFPKTVGQVPFTYNMLPPKPNGKYLGFGLEPEFPFGHGLSYTTFELTDFKISKATISATDSVVVSVKVTNTGKFAGDEVVQLYIHDEYASVSRPTKELKGFKRISVSPGETQTVNIPVKPEHLQMWNIDMKRVVEPGDFKIMVGTSSQNIKFTGKITVKNTIMK
ncbi:MAG TPA: glycoside hydrolase family 3 N-terminal domain-containing protein [Cytophagaceae bacterium]|jgi:beta-glucosidase